MKFTPYAYQERAVGFTLDHDRCCLFLDMGLGKSVVALTAFARLLMDGDAERALVVAPKLVAESTWSAEAEKWDHLRWLSVAVCMGTAKKRRAALAKGAMVTVINRDNFAWLLAECAPKGKGWPFDLIVIDELTSFKTPSSVRSKAMRKASAMARRVVGLTGTPAPNGLIDLWAQMYCVDLGATLGKSLTAYRDKYFSPVRWHGVVIKCPPKRGAEEQINALLAESCLTMQAKDYLDLPPMLVEDAWIEMPEAARKAYAAFERKRVMEFKAEAGSKSGVAYAASAAALMSKLAQMANGFVYDEEGHARRLHSVKLDMLGELLERAQAQGSGLLVFVEFVDDRAAILERFPDAREYKGDAELRGWNSGEIPMLVTHPMSTAYGLNMQAGGCCVAWYGLTWSLELYQQANARLYRQGQTKPVSVTRILARGTVDERAAAAIDSKAAGQKAMIDGLKKLMARYE